jgi:hypothetical protein
VTVLLTLKINKRRAVDLVILYTFGFASVAISIGRWASFEKGGNFLVLFDWPLAEINTTIMISCLPAFRPLFRKATQGVWPRASTRTISSNTTTVNAGNKNPENTGIGGWDQFERQFELSPLTLAQSAENLS